MYIYVSISMFNLRRGLLGNVCTRILNITRNKLLSGKLLHKRCDYKSL